jgi:hypothetical protein
MCSFRGCYLNTSNVVLLEELKVSQQAKILLALALSSSRKGPFVTYLNQILLFDVSEVRASPTRCNNFTSLLLEVYVWLNKFRVLSRPSSGAYICISSLWFYRRSVAVVALLVVVWQTTTNNATTATLQR